ncbi:MAG: formamidopyrimidine-DNA glycosylase [Deltaproteobacteria bacterium]|nr:formamidopyrimidine-DNA glycosylase [Deltaproteobacteria bacterium]
MPELPDVDVYVERLQAKAGGQILTSLRIGSPFLLRTVDPPASEMAGRKLLTVERLGKRIVMGLEDDLFMVLHLMVSGRIRWKDPGAKIPGRVGLAAFDFEDGTLILTEVSKKKRASLFLVRGREALADHDRGGIDPLTCGLKAFKAAITRENRTLKRGLTDPRIFSGIGNSYSDEILFHSKLPPTRLTSKLTDAQLKTLHTKTLEVLEDYRDRMRAEVGDGFPDKVTAFRDDFYVHGRYRKPCRVCDKPVQRIRYAENEVNYCAKCQCGGKLLADRGLSRLLKKDWPRSLDELEIKRSGG